MKKNYFLILALLFTAMGFSQIVNIPDANFKAKLLAANTTNNIAKNSSNVNIKIDVNNDLEIQVSEALTVYKLNVKSASIANLDGIAAFANLTDLDCSINAIDILDVGMLTNLSVLTCNSNGMSSINLVGANSLTYLVCNFNDLSTIDFTGLTNLTTLVCHGNDLTNLDATPLINLTTLKCYNNALTNLNVSGLTQLSELFCYNNQLVNLNLSGLSSLTNVDCNNNDLVAFSLNGSSQNLTIDCSYNLLTNLSLTDLSGTVSINSNNNQLSSFNFNNCPNINELDLGYNLFVNLDVSSITNIYSLKCYNNQLTSLDVSSLTNLYEFYCNSNQLTALNVSGLNNLYSFSCFDNQLTAINVSGLNNLTDFNCSYNQLTTLDVSGLNNLFEFFCSNNQLTSIDVSGANNLSVFDCSYNQFTILDLSSMQPYLYAFNCSNNFLSQLLLPVNASFSSSFNCDHNFLTSLPSTLNTEYLTCSYNLLTTLDIEVYIYQYYLDCSHNQLTNLNFLNNNILGLIDCSYNQLETLNIPFGMGDALYCDYNNLISIIAPDASASNLSFSNNPDLQYICTNPDFALLFEERLIDYGYNNVEINSYCTFTPDGEFYTIQGNHSFDFNNNGCDVNDLVVQHQKFTITDGTTVGNIVSDATGDYNISVQSGSHTITPVLENPNYFTITPNNITVTFPTQTSPVNQNFCLAPNGVHPDLEVIIVPLDSPLPGFDTDYKIIYKNKGTTTQSGSINFNFDDAVLDFVTSNPATNSQSTNNLNWNFSNLLPFVSGEIFFTLNVNTPTETPPVNGGDILHLSATITSAAADDSPADNTATLNQTVFNSFDPNDKTCLEGSNITPEMIGNYVHYKIRFENTGTANAQRIIVSDRIDLSKFDIATLIPIDGSHAFTTRIYDGNKVEFLFENIQLPFDDANNDGYVVFKIKTLPTLTLGDSFSNSAAIYFDYNYPIFTNEAVTTIQVLGTPDFDFGNYFTLYPNPASDVLNIASTKEITLTSIAIYNTLGQLVIMVPNAQNISTIDVSNLTSGSYFIKIISDKGSSSAKFLKK